MKKAIVAIVAAAVSVLSVPVASAAVIDDPVRVEAPSARVDVEALSAAVYVNRMPCADRCERKSVIVVSPVSGCYVNLKATLVSVSGGVATVRLTADRPRTTMLRASGCAKKATVNAKGRVSSVVDATTGLPVDTTVSETF